MLRIIPRRRSLPPNFQGDAGCPGNPPASLLVGECDASSAGDATCCDAKALHLAMAGTMAACPDSFERYPRDDLLKTRTERHKGPELYWRLLPGQVLFFHVTGPASSVF